MRPHKLTVLRNRRDHGSELRLRGKWLAAAGMLPGQKVVITRLSPGVLEIRQAAAPENENVKAERAMLMARLDRATINAARATYAAELAATPEEE